MDTLRDAGLQAQVGFDLLFDGERVFGFNREVPLCNGPRMIQDVGSAAKLCFKGVWDTLVHAPSDFIKDDILQFNQSFDSIASP